MSVVQSIASSRFIQAMGPMIEDEQKFTAVLHYISMLREQSSPCQFSDEQIMDFADQAEKEESEQINMMSHEDVLRSVATWVK